MNDDKAHDRVLPNWRSRTESGELHPPGAAEGKASGRDPARAHPGRDGARSASVYPRLVSDMSRGGSAARAGLPTVARVYPTFVLDPVRPQNSQRPFHPVHEDPHDAWPTIRGLVRAWIGLAPANESALVTALSTTLAAVERGQRERSLSLLAKLDLGLARKVGEHLGEVPAKGAGSSP